MKTRCSGSQEFNSDEQGLRRQSKPFWFHGKFGILSLGIIVVNAVASFLRYLEQKLKRKTGHEAFLMQGGLGMALLSTSTMAKDHISPVIVTLRANPTFMAGFLAWAIAQTTKVLTTYFVEGRWDFEKLLGSGGMPSSHSALCVGLTTSVAFCCGLSDCLFPVCLGFSMMQLEFGAMLVCKQSGRDKIETPEQFKQAEETVQKLVLDGVVVIGGDDSNTNACLLGEYFRAKNVKTQVRVPKDNRWGSDRVSKYLSVLGFTQFARYHYWNMIAIQWTPWLKGVVPAMRDQ